MEKQKLISELKTFLEEEKRTADSLRREEIDRLLMMYRFLPTRVYGPEEPIIASSLIKIRHASVESYVFLVPQGGGLVTRVGDFAVQVITAQSPLGEALLGKKSGDRVRVEVRGDTREYEIVFTS